MNNQTLTPTKAAAAWNKLDALKARIEKSTRSKYLAIAQSGMLFNELQKYYKATAGNDAFKSLLQGKGWNYDTARLRCGIGRGIEKFGAGHEAAVDKFLSAVDAGDIKLSEPNFRAFLNGNEKKKETAGPVLSGSYKVDAKGAIKVTGGNEALQREIEAVIARHIAREKEASRKAAMKLAASQKANQKARAAAAAKLATKN